jgi:hypothetical protein
MSSRTEWMIYGANGYTGHLVAAEARRRGLNPVLAGRRAGPIKKLAAELGLPMRVFGLDDAPALAAAIADMAVVANCAGPFAVTSAPMIDACLTSRAHYLDITGEIDVFLAEQAPRSVMLFRRWMLRDLERAKALKGASVIWSQWEGYLKEGSGAQLEADCAARGILFEVLHTSGHASIGDLKRLAAAVNPNALVPIHTFFGKSAWKARNWLARSHMPETKAGSLTGRERARFC